MALRGQLELLIRHMRRTVGRAADGATDASLLERFVAGVQREDLLTFSTMSFVLLAASLLASFLPAHRASRIDPMAALRQE